LDDHVLAHHRRFPKATIGNGPGHNLFDTFSVSPGPSDCIANDKFLAHWTRASSATIGYGPGHGSRTQKHSSPGPASYNPNDRCQAHQRNFPSATFGRAAGHDLQRSCSSLPGPADFCADDAQQARRRRSSSVVIGRGPGHQTANGSSKESPGPATYNKQDNLLAHHRSVPAATIGHGPGHNSLLVSDTEPAPGSYNLANDCFDSRHKRPASVSIACTGRERASAEERLNFRTADQNSDGTLDPVEVECLLRRRFPDMKSAEVHAILKAADRNKDGKLDFHEVIEFTHGLHGGCRSLREKLQMALPGPELSQISVKDQERWQFRRADRNFDGYLDPTELESLLRREFHDIKKRDVRDIFQAVDQNHDGKLDFQEVADFTRSRDPSRCRLREKMKMALAASPPRPRAACGPASRPSSTGSSSKLRRASSASAVGNLIANRRNSA